MEIPFYQIDAFTSKTFRGNPAGVCLLAHWLSDSLLQSIAAENNLPETAFVVEAGQSYELRWFTPTVEVDLCGHATLASAYALLTYVVPSRKNVVFITKSGLLTVSREAELLVLDFPARAPVKTSSPEVASKVFGLAPREVLQSRDLLMVFDSEEQIGCLVPDLDRISSLEYFAVIATARGNMSDYVCRFFAPRQGIPEDPATGSAQCTLAPYWSQRLGKRSLHALQLSARGGEFFCTDLSSRVAIGGHAVTFLTATMHISE